MSSNVWLCQLLEPQLQVLHKQGNVDLQFLREQVCMRIKVYSCNKQKRTWHLEEAAPQPACVHVGPI